MYIEKSGYKTETSGYADHICLKENQFSKVPESFWYNCWVFCYTCVYFKANLIIK